MLMLTRKPGQKVFVGDSIEVVVLEVNGNQVKLGFTAPKEVNIVREEVLKREIKEAAKANGLTETYRLLDKVL